MSGVVVVSLLVAAGFGYWSMVVFRRKGRNKGAGFALGFLLPLILSLLNVGLVIIGGLVAVGICYALPAGKAKDYGTLLK